MGLRYKLISIHDISFNRICLTDKEEEASFCKRSVHKCHGIETLQHSKMPKTLFPNIEIKWVVRRNMKQAKSKFTNQKLNFSLTKLQLLEPTFGISRKNPTLLLMVITTSSNQKEEGETFFASKLHRGVIITVKVSLHRDGQHHTFFWSWIDNTFNSRSLLI